MMKQEKVRWGIMGVAGIAVRKVIPAMQGGSWSEVIAVASRDLSKAQRAARELGIRKAYGSYEELLADPEIEAIYNPLPNHLHVPLSIKAAEAGKHVLCEKPISLSVEEAKKLLAVRDRTGIKIEEAFMVRTHPQWVGVRDAIKSGRIGDVRSIIGNFSYHNKDPENIRNVEEWGGGGLMDIGCYHIFTSRFIFDQEPERVIGVVERDSSFGVDILTSAILDFPGGQSVFTCGTRMVPSQRVQVLGTNGRIEIAIPFNAPSDKPTRIYVDDGSDISGGGIQTLEFEPADQYRIQGDLFSKAIRENGEVAVPLEYSIKNIAIIEAIFRSATTGRWERPNYN
jgi:predicted dehydrogenase